MQTYQTGDSLIFKVPEREISLQPAALYPEAFPVAEAEAVIQPIALSIHSWVVQTPDLIVIDTATGNGRERGGNPLYHQLNTPYLENLRAAGVNPEDVTLVLLTHLHTDHVGWNTVWQDDRWVPLFPNARYLCSAKELSRVKNSERYRALWLDSLLPVIEAGQLETVDVATRPRVGGRIDFIPTPGHSPDHAALILAAGDDYACFSGDLLHSPIQFAHPQWNSAFCGDPRQAEVSRREMMAWGQAIMLNGSPGILPGLPAAGWRRISKVTIAGERPGNRLQIRGTVMNNAQTVLVFGATGQQGGSVARALLHRGWRVRALVRDPFSAGAAALAARGAELVVGTFEDRAAMRSAMAGVDGVFSVQPSSPGGTVTDEQEVRYGITIADLAVECGVKHLVYSSGSATGETPTGVAHYDTKAEIERHIRRLPLAATIVRPATFMELLVMPGFGLDEGRFQFFMLPEENAGAGGGGYRPSCRGGFCRAGAVCRQDVRDRQRQRDRSSAGGVILRGGGTADPLFAIFRRGAGRQSFSAQADRAGGRRAAGRARRPRRPAPAAPAAAHLRRLAGRPRPSRLRAGADQRGSLGV